MRKRLMMVVLPALLLAPVALEAQTPLPISFELRAGAGLPMGDMADADLKTGFGGELTASYSVIPMMDVYAGFNWYRFDADSEDVDVSNTDAGYALGARISPPFVPALSPWVRVGGVYDKVETSSDAGDFSTDHGFGWEVGAGVSFPVGGMFAVTPGVRYRAFSPEVEGAEAGDVTYMAVELGIQASL